MNDLLFINKGGATSTCLHFIHLLVRIMLKGIIIEKLSLNLYNKQHVRPQMRMTSLMTIYRAMYSMTKISRKTTCRHLMNLKFYFELTDYSSYPYYMYFNNKYYNRMLYG